METVHIFLTGRAAEGYADFLHGERRYAFGCIDAQGPRRVIEGRVHIFIDWLLDDRSGLDLCRRLRGDPRLADAHITMVLEHDDIEDKRRALRADADDYVIGPIDRASVLDRLLGMAIGPLSLPRRVLTDGALEIDLAALQARWQGKAIPLRPNEFRLLQFFAENPDRVHTREALIEGLGKREPPIDARTVDVWIGRLRSALRRAGAADPIRTIRAAGYVYDSIVTK